jgi:hypothetical protein
MTELGDTPLKRSTLRLTRWRAAIGPRFQPSSIQPLSRGSAKRASGYLRPRALRPQLSAIVGGTYLTAPSGVSR